MPTQYTTALDEMFGMANNVFLNNVVLGYVPDVRWPGVPLSIQPDKTKLWARVSAQIVTDSQAALANSNDVRLFDATGMLYVQLFCPRNVGASLDNGRALAVALQAAFRHTSPSGELWYRNGKIVELPEALENYPVLVSVEFEYRTTAPATPFVLPSGGGTTDMPSTPYHKVAAAGTNASVIKGSAGMVMGWKVYNNGILPAFVKLYNKATTPVPGTDPVKQTIGVDAGADASGYVQGGITYDTGIGIAMVRGILDSDNTPVLAGDLDVNIFWQ